MKIAPITHNKFINSKTTGYAATVSLGLAVLSGVSKNKSFRKSHKFLSYATVALTALHIGLIEYYNYKFKKSV